MVYKTPGALRDRGPCRRYDDTPTPKVRLRFSTLPFFVRIRFSGAYGEGKTRFKMQQPVMVLVSCAFFRAYFHPWQHLTQLFYVRMF